MTRRHGCNTLLFLVEMDGWLLFPSRFTDPDRIRWSQDQVPDFCRDAAEVIQHHDPNTCLIVDWHGPTMACIDSGENVLASCRHVDAFIQECYFEHSGEHPSFVARESLALAAETRRPVWYARWLTRNLGHVSVCEPETTALGWFNDAVATGNVPVLIDIDHGNREEQYHPGRVLSRGPL